MKTVDNAKGFGKASANSLTHRISHIRCYLFHCVKQFFGQAFHHFDNLLRGCSRCDSCDSSFPAFSCLAGDDGIKFAIAKGTN
jgi:hypothetical protein